MKQVITLSDNAANRIKEILGVDILMYQEIDDLVEAVTRRGDNHIENPCMACLDGHYVINGRKVHELVHE